MLTYLNTIALDFFKILENKNLSQILGFKTHSCIEEA